MPLILVALFFLNVAARSAWYAPLLSAAVAAAAVVVGWSLYGKKSTGEAPAAT